MTKGLVRFQETGDLHFVTFSCYRRRPYLDCIEARNIFERSLETMRVRYDFLVYGYVVMPEHVHLLIGEPRKAILAKALQALNFLLPYSGKKGPSGKTVITTSTYSASGSELKN